MNPATFNSVMNGDMSIGDSLDLDGLLDDIYEKQDLDIDVQNWENGDE